MLSFKKEDYMKEVDNGYISRREHPDYIHNHLVILNYTPKTTYENIWNEITLTCRGLIINEMTNKVVSMPFGKFFNYGQQCGLDITPPNNYPEVTIKYDGSLGISYKIDGKVYWATRGSFESDQAKVAQRIWDEKYHDKYIPDNVTLLAEIIHPETRVVVKYDFIDLVAVGATNIYLNKDYKYNELAVFTHQLRMRTTERVELNLESAVHFVKKLDCNNEGFVLRWSNGFRLKVKSDEYMKVHKIICGLSEKQILEYWVEDKINNLIESLPEEFRGEIEQKRDNYSKLEVEIYEEVFANYKLAPKSDRKEFALWVNGNIKSNRHLLYLLFDGKVIRYAVKEAVYKSFKEKNNDEVNHDGGIAR